MRNIHQLNRSHFTISIMALMLIVSLSGMGFAADSKVDINTGTAKELQKLPGIGQGLAKRIIDYRTANGPFKTVEDVVKVKGIGKKMFVRMQDRLTVGSSSQIAVSE